MEASESQYPPQVDEQSGGDAQLCLGQTHDALVQALVAVVALAPQDVKRLDVEVALSPVVAGGKREVVRACGGGRVVGRERVGGKVVGEDEDGEASAQERDGGSEADASGSDDCRE